MSWQTKKIGDILEIQNGYAFDSKLFSFENGKPLIRIRDIKNGIKTETNYIGDFDSKYIVKRGDFLIGMDGEFACYEWKGDDALLNQRVCRLHNFKDEISPKFLFYGINNYLKSIEDITTFTTVKHISSKQIANIEFPLPPLSIQEKIVFKLDKIFAEIEKAVVDTEINIKNAEALFQCYLTEVFEVKAKDSESCELNLLCNFLNGYAFKSTEAIESSNIQLLRMGNLYNDELDLTRSPVFYPNNFASLYSKFLIEVGDILISLTGTVGKRDYGYAVRVEELPVNLLLNQRILKIYDIKKTVINSDYLFYFLHSNMFLDDLYKSANGTRQANLSSDYIKKIKIPLIAIDEQNQVVNKLENIKNNCSLMKDSLVGKLANLAQLKQSVLQQAFNGELVKG